MLHPSWFYACISFVVFVLRYIIDDYSSFCVISPDNFPLVLPSRSIRLINLVIIDWDFLSRKFSATGGITAFIVQAITYIS